MEGAGALCAVETHVLHVEEAKVQPAGFYYSSNIYHGKGEVSAFGEYLGKGKIQVLCRDVGNHNVQDVRGYNEIPPIGPLKVSVICSCKPQSVVLEPGNIEVDYEYIDGKIELVIPKLEIHQVIKIISDVKYNTYGR